MDIESLKRSRAVSALLISYKTNGYTMALVDYNTSVIKIDAFQGHDVTDYAKTLNTLVTMSLNGAVLPLPPSRAGGDQLSWACLSQTSLLQG